MHSRFRRNVLGVALAALGAALPAGRAAAQDERASIPDRCGVGYPRDEARGYVPLPSGDVFCPLVADPKEARSFVAYQRSDSSSIGLDIGAIGIGDRFGLLRLGGREPGNGVEFSLVGAVFAQFDLDASSLDLVNADYTIGLPITFRHGGFSGRLRVYHQSSHIGDEFLLRGDTTFRRENLAFEAVELLLSRDVGPLRAYAGGEYLFHVDPKDLERYTAHAGAELRPPGTAAFGTLGSVGFVAGLDLKSSQQQDWHPSLSARAGFEFGRRRFTDPSARRWSLLGEYYNGPSPYGQFFHEKVRYWGVGIHFTI